MKRILTTSLVLLTAVATWAASAKTMYEEATAREQEVRAALAAPDATADALKDVHALVASYETIVKQYPTSGYSDNALWQAGLLSLDAFAKFNQPEDKAAGVRLLNRLAATYIHSKFASQVPEQLARVDSATASKEPAAAAEKKPPVAAAAPPAPAAPPPVPAAVQTAAPKPATGTTGKIATIKEIRRSVLTDAVRVTIELDAEVPFHEERIANPSRVFLDLPGTRAAAALVDRTLRFESDADIVRQIRIGRHPNNTTRVVLDADGVTSYSVYPLYSPYRLVIDCVRPLPSVAIAAPGDPPPAVAAAASPSPPKGADLAPVSTVPPVSPTTPAEPPAKNLNGSLSMARQLGLGVSRIVIDAGHGGHDPGAKGKGVNESELVLDIALRLEKLLQKVQGVEVILTRRTDDFVVLEERPAIANRESADLFLSIHANASRNAQANGIETYFLNFANNQSAAAVAARENATSALGMGALPDVVKAIARNNKVDESREFANQVQTAMVDKLKGSNKALKDLGVKQAPFVVLIGATMPAVLAEISFVTNPQEARLVKGNPYRQRIAEALFNAIRKYQSSLKTTATVAHQEP
jgi:N-acetylmuramoyl-L-alanine amidase